MRRQKTVIETPASSATGTYWNRKSGPKWKLKPQSVANAPAMPQGVVR
jgi:hypothetical protein